jgi:hypothetical protein
MTDMIARKDVSGSGREAPKVKDSRPAYKQEDPSDQPPADIREQSLRHFPPYIARRSRNRKRVCGRNPSKVARFASKLRISPIRPHADTPIPP